MKNMKAVTLEQHIESIGVKKCEYADAVGVSKTHISRQIREGFIVVDGTLYSPRPAKVLTKKGIVITQ